MTSDRIVSPVVVIALAAAVLVLSSPPSEACTNILVTKGASADGSTMITYACDGRFHPRLEHSAPADHPPGAEYEIRHWSGELRGVIPQVVHTYAVVGLMNEHQLAIAETTTTGREELENPDGLLHYWDLMQLALERAAHRPRGDRGDDRAGRRSTATAPPPRASPSPTPTRSGSWR